MKKRFRFILLFLIYSISVLNGLGQSEILSNDSLRALDIIPLMDMKSRIAESSEFIETNTLTANRDTLQGNTNNKDLLFQEGQQLKEVARFLITKTNNINLIQLEFNRLSTYSNKLKTELTAIEDKVELYSESIATSNTLLERWEKTNAYYEKVGLDKSLEQSKSFENELEEIEQILRAQLNRQLDLQAQYISELNEVDNLLQVLADIQNNFLSNLLEPGQPSLWELGSDTVAQDSLAVNYTEISDVLGLGSWQTELKNFLADNKERAKFHLLLSLFILVSLITFKSAIKEAKIEADKLKVIVALFTMPLISWALITIILGFLIYPSIPFAIRPVLLATASIPIFILGLRIVKASFRAPLIIILVLYNVHQIIEIYGMGIGWFRFVMLLEAVAGMLAMYYIAKARLTLSDHSVFFWRAFVISAPYMGALFAIALVLNVFGYIALSQIITSVVSNGFMTALIVVILLRTAYGLLHMLLYHSLLTKLHVVRNYGSTIHRRIMQLLSIYLVFVWLLGLLRKAMLAQPASLFWMKIYTDEYSYGALSISIQKLTEFFVVLFGSAILANVIRAILQEDLLIHFNLKRGVPKAIAMVTKYTLLVVGFFLAVSSMGVDIDKLGFLAGGLGVGIGFGLQNIVGNFISGLILIFERPIHEGDVVVAGQTEGEVKEIGLRSCTVRSWDGAEVIVPNQEFISSRVTNWTLSDAQRRKELLIKTKLEANPQEVVDAISRMLAERTDILLKPEPMVLYLGNSEYAHDFRILFWLNRNLLVSSSRVALAIHNKLSELGVANPVPVREIREHKKAD